MMDTSSNNDLIKQIERYQSSILKVNPPESDPPRILHCIRKLSKLPIRYEELEETGIGKTINALRKRNGGIAEEATLLVAKWKSIVKKQVEAEEALEEKYEDDTQSDYDDSPKLQPPVNGIERTVQKEETETKIPKSGGSSKLDSASENKVHLITIKKPESNDRKRKNSDEKDKSIKKEKHKKIDEGSKARITTENKLSVSETVNVIPGKAKKEVKSEVRDPEGEEKKKKDKHDDKKHKKEHEKRHHKSSKHSSHRDEKHHRHHSKSSHHEKKQEEISETHKHKDKKSKSRSKHDNEKKDKKERKSSKELSEPESSGHKSKGKRNSDSRKVEESVDEGDFFGAALLSIPNATTPSKKRSPSSKSSVYQDYSPSTVSPQRSVTDLNLLSNDVKLEPLDLDDYFKTQDDFYSPKRSSPPEKSNHQRMQSDEDMFASMTTTKNQRTKVFSGNKSCCVRFPTLFELCVRILQDNFDALEYTGGVPYDVLKPILEKVSAQQLLRFEDYNPYLIGETDELWEYHAKKEFRKAERQEYETYRDLYMRCCDEREEKFLYVAENLKKAKANASPVRKTQLAYVGSTVKPPRNVVRSQAKHGTGNIVITKSPKGPQPSPAAIQSVKERLAKDAMTPSAVQIVTKPSSLRALKKKKAPLMLKMLQRYKGLRR